MTDLRIDCGSSQAGARLPLSRRPPKPAPMAIPLNWGSGNRRIDVSVLKILGQNNFQIVTFP